MGCQLTDSSESAAVAATSLSATEEQVARGIVVAHRARLDWLLRVPEWENLLPEAVAALELPGQRQGIGFQAALMALPLEHKHEVVRWVAARFQQHIRSSVARGICRVCGIERFDQRDLEEHLSVRQWMMLREEMLFRLGKDHRRYKHAQQLLFTGYHHLVDEIVGQVVFRAEHRADCRQEGALALLQAIDRVDESSHDLGAYGSAWIRRAIRNYLMRQRLPVHAPVNLISRATVGRSEAPTRGATPPPESEGTARLRALLLECLQHPSVSLDEPAEPGSVAMHECMVDDRVETPVSAAVRSDLRDLIRGLLELLTPKQRHVLVARYGLQGGECLSLSEIARGARISHQQVSMREQRALRRLETMLAPVVGELAGAV